MSKTKRYEHRRSRVSTRTPSSTSDKPRNALPRRSEVYLADTNHPCAGHAHSFRQQRRMFPRLLQRTLTDAKNHTLREHLCLYGSVSLWASLLTMRSDRIRIALLCMSENTKHKKENHSDSDTVGDEFWQNCSDVSVLDPVNRHGPSNVLADSSAYAMRCLDLRRSVSVFRRPRR